jgi:integrase
MGRMYRRGGGKGRFGLHRLRHLFGTTASEHGMHPLISQLIMGHEDEKSQCVYQHPSAATIKLERRKGHPDPPAASRAATQAGRSTAPQGRSEPFGD